MEKIELDARRMLCPMPVIRTQNRINELEEGNVLTVVCTDPGVVHDIPTWCRINGHKVLGIDQQSDEIRITIEVGSAE
jgi:tRNA 2-thiouridine synthesizing protein A